MRLALLVMLVTSLAFPMTKNDEPTGRAIARHAGRAIREGGLQELARRSDIALDAMIRVAVRNMREIQDLRIHDQADILEWEWNTRHRGELTRLVMSGRGIGDHAPLILWLEGAYEVIELALGVEVCKALHLSDIKTMNCGIPVVFNPKHFPMDQVQGERIDEYRRHFAKDDTGGKYYGVMPVVIWWGISIGCWAGTSGVGSFLCSIAATAAEWLSARTIAPALSDFIFERFGE